MRSLILLCIALVIGGCGKKQPVAEAASPAVNPAEPTATPSQPVAPAANPAQQPVQTAQTAPPPSPVVAQPAVAAGPDMSAALGELTQAVRRYGMEKRKVPATVEEVMGAGYIRTMPAPPVGKKFAIDKERMEVVLVRK